MRLVKKPVTKEGKRKADRLNSAGMEARESDISCVPRAVAMEKLNLEKRELKNIREDHYKLMISLQLTQKKLGRVRGEAKKKELLTESFSMASKGMERGGEGPGRGQEELPKRRRYENYMQECFYGFGRVVYGQVLKYAKVETSELCFDLVSVARSWKNESEIIGESEVSSLFVLAKKGMVLRCPLQLASETRPGRPSTDQKADEFFKYVVEI